MKKIILFFAAIALVSCSKTANDYVTLKGKFEKPSVESFKILGSNGYEKEIAVNKEDGTFSDTLKVSDGLHGLQNGTDRGVIYLKNGFNIDMVINGEQFENGITFSGDGAATNSFMEKKRMFYGSDFANPKTYFTLEKEAYQAKLAEAKALLKEYRDEVPDLDSVLAQMDSRNDEMFFGYVESNYEKMSANLVRLAKGKKSPEFTNYENFNGGTNSLSDFKGKYVYIDVWATWCAPCKAQIPFLKELEKEYEGKNIEFISISVDESNAYDTWKQMVKDEALAGVQLYADNNFESQFILDYGINAIPRFILIDPDGNIVDSDVARPSDPALKELFTELGI